MHGIKPNVLAQDLPISLLVFFTFSRSSIEKNRFSKAKPGGFCSVILVWGFLG